MKSLSFVVALVFGMCSAVADLTLSLTKGKESAQSLLSLIYHRYEVRCCCAWLVSIELSTPLESYQCGFLYLYRVDIR